MGDTIAAGQVYAGRLCGWVRVLEIGAGDRLGQLRVEYVGGRFDGEQWWWPCDVLDGEAWQLVTD